MKLKFIFVLLFVTTSLLAKVQVSPMFGYNFSETNTQIKEPGYLLGLIETQIDFKDSKISPELSFMYLPYIDYKSPNGISARGLRSALNIVYTPFDSSDWRPTIKAGIGYESIWKNETPNNQDSVFFDLGVGLTYSFTDEMALKVEAIYLNKPKNNKDKNVDNHLATLIGFTYTFNTTTKEKMYKEDEINKELPSDEKSMSVKKIVLQSDLLFKKNNIQFTYLGKESLKKVVKNIKQNDRIVVTGYTDSIGTIKDNLERSQLQVDSVKWQLFDYGISTQRIETHAMGEANPITSNMLKQGRSKNRRIEIEIKSY